MPSAERRLVLHMSRVGAEEGRPFPIPSGLDWEGVIECAEEQGVLPLVCRGLLLGCTSDLPAEAVALIRASAEAGTRTTLAQTAALLELLEAMGRAGVEILPFKGPTLALQAYGDLGLRSFNDLDVLVRPSATSSARGVLGSLGYAPSFPTSEARRTLLLRRGSHESFERADGSAVELHWRIAAPISDFRLDYDRLWSRVSHLEIAGRRIPVLGPEDSLLVLCVHGTKHAWERLAWICDVAHLLQAHPELDWSTALGEATRMRATRIVLLGLHLAGEVGGGRVPAEPARRIASEPTIPALARPILEDLLSPPRSGAGTFRFHLTTRERWPDKLALALGGLVALNQHDLDIVHLPDGALALHYVTRPLRLAGKSLAYLARRLTRP